MPEVAREHLDRHEEVLSRADPLILLGREPLCRAQALPGCQPLCRAQAPAGDDAVDVRVKEQGLGPLPLTKLQLLANFRSQKHVVTT